MLLFLICLPSKQRLLNIVTCMISTSIDIVIVDFYKKKKADGLAPKSAFVVSMNS